MLLEDFKREIPLLLERAKFEPLFKSRASESSPAGNYLESRGLSADKIECYDFNGKFEYQSKVYNLPDCVVIPLRGVDGVLRGVWIRFLEEKRFFIWMCNQTFQKYWIDLQDENEPVFVAESIFDACSLREMFGFKNVAACLGAQISGEFVELLNNQNKEVVMAFDQDRPGYLGMLKHLNQCDTANFKIFEITGAKPGLKDYNDIMNFTDPAYLGYEIKQGIQAKVSLKSKLS